MEVTRKSASHILKNEHFLTPDRQTYVCTCACQGVRNVCFLESMTCFVFLLIPFLDSPFWLHTDALWKFWKFLVNVFYFFNNFVSSSYHEICLFFPNRFYYLVLIYITFSIFITKVSHVNRSKNVHINILIDFCYLFFQFFKHPWLIAIKVQLI